MQELLVSLAPVVTIFGKSSLFQVKEILQTTPERNLELITGSLSYLKPRVEELFYDAEHFFDGFKDDRDYALKTLDAALKGGAQYLVLCDTNGGTLTSELIEIIKVVKKRFPKAALGIHAHNDSELAVANSVAAVELGCSQVQGTINGVGERCGNANLCSIIPNLQLKMGLACLDPGKLKRLTEVSRFVYEAANARPNRYQPYVGKSAFAHKGGIHAAAVKRNPKAYEHIDPALVGNARVIPVSDLSGRGNILMKAQELGLELGTHDAAVRQAMDKLQTASRPGGPGSGTAALRQQRQDHPGQGQGTGGPGVPVRRRRGLPGTAPQGRVGPVQGILPASGLPDHRPEGGRAGVAAARGHPEGPGGTP